MHGAFDHPIEPTRPVVVGLSWPPMQVSALVQGGPAARAASPLYGEFVMCQRLVSQEAVSNTVRALAAEPTAATLTFTIGLSYPRMLVYT